MVRERLADHLGPSTVAGLLLCAAAVFFGGSRDFGLFLLSLAVLPFLVLLVLVFVVADARGARRSAAGLGMALIVAVPAVYLAAVALRDRARFAGWAVRHPSILLSPGQTRIIEPWDGWGIAGMENDSYLVVDQRHDLGSVAGNLRWSREVRQTCPVVDARRMWSSIYIVTTYNCPFSEVPLL